MVRDGADNCITVCNMENVDPVTTNRSAISKKNRGCNKESIIANIFCYVKMLRRDFFYIKMVIVGDFPFKMFFLPVTLPSNQFHAPPPPHSARHPHWRVRGGRPQPDPVRLGVQHPPLHRRQDHPPPGRGRGVQRAVRPRPKEPEVLHHRGKEEVAVKKYIF